MGSERMTAARIAVLMGLLTLGSKLIGFVRTLVTANFYGTSFINDAFTLSQDIPVILFGALFSAVATTYMPVYSRTRRLHGEESANGFTCQSLNLLMMLSIVSSIVGFFCSDGLAELFGRLLPGNHFSAQAIELTAFYLKVSFSFLFFTSIATLLEAFLQYQNVFLPQILVGYGQTICIIFVTVISAYTSYYLLVFGVMLGAAFRAAGIFFIARRHGFHYVRSRSRGSGAEADTRSAAREIMALSIPVFIGGSINQINTLVDKFLAAGLPEGTISALGYGSAFITMVSTLTVTILVTIVYPKLTQANLGGDFDHFNRMAAQGMNVTLIISVPFTLGAMVYSDQLVQVVFERGSFDSSSVAMTSPALFYYSIGLTFVALNALLVKIYYAVSDARTPVICAAAGAAVNVGLDLLLVGPMAQGGLALATSCSAAVNALLLWMLLRRRHPQVHLRDSVEKAWAILLFSALSVGASYGLFRFLEAHIWMPRMVLLAIAVLCAAVIYWILLCHGKIEETELLKKLLEPLSRKKRRNES